MKMRIMLVDDHLMFRDGLASLVSARDDMELAGGAANGRDALTCIREILPDVVILDVSMPEMNGIETARQIHALFPAIRLLALSAHTEHHIILEMLRAGSSGYVLKVSPFTELVEAVHTVMQNRIFISPAVSGPLVMEYMKSPQAVKQSAFSILTSREMEILQSITEGMSTKEIASGLSLSVKTVETHRQQIMDKLDIHSIAELTKYAIREEITTV